MKLEHFGVAAVTVTLLFGCASGNQAPPASATGGTDDSSADRRKAQDDGATRLAISDDIRKACGDFDLPKSYFDYNSANVRAKEKDALDRLARCFLDGPLKGRGMLLVGHADPRGDEEYNLALGGTRAESIKRVLVKKGLPTSSVATSSRGELDSAGADEAGWQQDRRVEVMLRQ